MKADLHIHSTYSDGEYTPAQLLEMANMAALSVLSITDHDSISAYDEIESSAKEKGITLIRGIEITTRSENEQHILSYGFDVKSPGMSELIDDLASLRRLRAEELFGYLSDMAVLLPPSEISELRKQNYIGRPMIAEAIVRAGYAKSIEDAFDRYLVSGAFKSLKRPKPEAESVIHMLRRAGAVVALAHPFSLKLKGEEFKNKVEELKSFGLNAIECYYGAYNDVQKSYLCDIAAEYGLIITGGSDFHGEKRKPGIGIGDGGYEISVKLLSQIT